MQRQYNDIDVKITESGHSNIMSIKLMSHDRIDESHHRVSFRVFHSAISHCTRV